MGYRRKKHIVSAISFLFIFLFTYTAASKLYNMNGLIGSIARHPLFSTYSKFLAWTVIGLEFAAVLMILILPLRIYGLAVTSILMVGFTFYIGSMLWISEKLPCSCGGIIREMSWSSHFILNIILTLLAVVGFVFEYQLRKRLAWA